MPNVEGVSISFDSAATRAALKNMQRDFDRASMQGVRAAGRKVKQTMRKKAPVYSGDDDRATPGALKNSVHSSKRLKKEGPSSYSVRVGPMTPAVVPYRAKAEAKTGFAKAGFEDAAPAVAEAFDKAYRRVIDKAGR